MQQNMNSMQVQIDSLVEQQASFVTNLSGGEPVTVTGQTDEEEEIV